VGARGAVLRAALRHAALQGGAALRGRAGRLPRHRLGADPDRAQELQGSVPPAPVGGDGGLRDGCASDSQSWLLAPARDDAIEDDGYMPPPPPPPPPPCPPAGRPDTAPCLPALPACRCRAAAAQGGCAAGQRRRGLPHHPCARLPCRHGLGGRAGQAHAAGVPASQPPTHPPSLGHRACMPAAFTPRCRPSVPGWR
jgi:hypothetical protein